MDFFLQRDFRRLFWSALLVCLQVLGAQSQSAPAITLLDFRESIPAPGAVIKYSEEIYGQSSPWQVKLFTYPEHQLVCTYYYSDLTSKIKEGPYLKYYANGQLADSGSFKSNRKYGWHKEWYENGNVKSLFQYSFDVPVNTGNSWYETGEISTQLEADENGSGTRTEYYRNGKIQGKGSVRNGVPHKSWQYYKENGKPLMNVSFMEGEAISTVCFTGNGRQSTNECTYASEPTYPGGNNAWMQYLHDNLSYPAEAKKKKISGHAICLFEVDANGNLHNFNVVYSPDPSLSEAFIDALKNSPQWIPAKFLNKPISYRMKQEINFKEFE
ncbi:MAG TPA: energy transducer TonB [Phnomibacter sp.]|nr:energy transducer TonB [Phnomibacter sp.]